MAKQDRAVRTRRELIHSAAETFDRFGFADASIAQICTRAGVSHGALHFHFGNKQALGEAVESAAARTLLYITGNVPLRHPMPLQLLVDTSHALAQWFSCDPVLRAGFGLGHDATWHGRADLWQQWQDWVRLMLAVAENRGHLAPDVRPDDTASAITAMIAGLEVLGRYDAHWHTYQAVTPFWRLVLPQLSAEAVRGRIDAAGTCKAPFAVQKRSMDEARDGDWRISRACDALPGC
ncbi:TetR/AcrR family transcriptional regulator [Streptomyces verrucosisporus]|uniref:ScbR family autoregulator-binding transcription factor n=1 Tax=Streptomyces verrucosisporus TaxID=1695161 RepID=UPI0019D1715C|nr:ScbR family autoregulator-binding transcription factor [Streptomyces verrucosisporus]MBN3932085.1 TetR/AcrR family transcriptional regulator [Streptomyces verrucosisporus]